jgi:hypothetical protein
MKALLITLLVIITATYIHIEAYKDGIMAAGNSPKLELPEEFMCVVSENKHAPDTVLVYQSISNDSLYINFLNH